MRRKRGGRQAAYPQEPGNPSRIRNKWNRPTIIPRLRTGAWGFTHAGMKDERNGTAWPGPKASEEQASTSVAAKLSCLNHCASCIAPVAMSLE